MNLFKYPNKQRKNEKTKKQKNEKAEIQKYILIKI